MNPVKRDLMIAAVLTVAIVIMASALFAKLAHSDGLYPPPPSPGMVMPPFPHRVVQRSCWETAIQLGYQTGNPNVALAAVEACRIYAPWRPNEPQVWPVPLGIYPPSIPLPPLDR